MDLPIEFQSLLLRSACVAGLVYDKSSEQLSWSGWTEPLSPYWNDSLPSSLIALCSRLKPACSARLKSFFINGGDEESFPLDFLTRRPGSAYFFVVTPSHQNSNPECFFHVLDRRFDRIHSQAPDQNKVEIDRTEEGHHRAKNILQSIISYLNLLVSGRDSLSKREIERVIRYVHVLASLHDVLHDQLMERGRLDIIRLDRVFLALISRISSGNNITWNEIPVLVVRSARAASLSLLINEIIDLICLEIEPDCAMTIQIEMVTSDKARVEISRALKPGEIEIPDLSLVPGMRIIELLTRADRQVSFDLSIEKQRLLAVFELQVNAEGSI